MSIIFMTDLDGTLLGHDDFSCGVIREDLLGLIRQDIKVVLNSSKTKAEIDLFCESLGVRLPFICENGAAFFNSDILGLSGSADTPQQAGTDVATLMTAWHEAIDTDLRRHCIFLDDMEPVAQSRLLGLSDDDLDRAMDRQFSALFAFCGPDDRFVHLQRQAERAGILIHTGGRVHCLSGHHDKSGYNNFIRQHAACGNAPLTLIGFGDSNNDVAMLCDADIACVVPRPMRSALKLPNPPAMVITAPQPAPTGWLIAATQVLTLLEQQA